MGDQAIGGISMTKYINNIVDGKKIKLPLIAAKNTHKTAIGDMLGSGQLRPAVSGNQGAVANE